MVRLCVNLKPEQATALKARAAASGVLQSEIVRRVLDEVLASEIEQGRAKNANA